jgi:hypothetical protein
MIIGVREDMACTLDCSMLTREKPIALQWMNPKSLSDVSDTNDAFGNKMSDNVSNHAPYY